MNDKYSLKDVTKSPDINDRSDYPKLSENIRLNAKSPSNQGGMPERSGSIDNNSFVGRTKNMIKNFKFSGINNNPQINMPININPERR